MPRPDISESTIKRLQSLGNFSPTTSIDWMINSILDKFEGKKK